MPGSTTWPARPRSNTRRCSPPACTTHVWLKREDEQPVFSFKCRGAYNRMVHLSPAELRRGVIAASAGNHAQGVAPAAARLGTRAVIVMPRTTPQIKVDAVRRLDGRVVLHGDNYDAAYDHARRLGRQRRRWCSSIPTTILR